MFGYLNLLDPRDIGDNEAQEMVNCRLEKGYLEYAKFPPTGTPNRSIAFPEVDTAQNGILFLDALFPQISVYLQYQKTGSANKFDLGNFITESLAGITTGMVATQYATPGVYEYILTLVDTGTLGEESEILKTMQVTVTAGNHLQLTVIPTIASLTNKTLNWKLYRRPLGSEEFLLVDTFANGTATRDDVTLDTNLGEAYDTSIRSNLAKNKGPDAYSNSIYRLNNCLVVPNILNQLFISDLDKLFSFPTENIFKLPGDRIYSIFEVAEALRILTNAGISTIYGNTPGTEGDMVLKNLTKGLEGLTFQYNTFALVNGIAFFPYLKSRTYTGSGGYTETFDNLEGIFLYSGGNPTDITAKIRPLFPRVPSNYTVGGTWYLGNGAKIEVFENRFVSIDVSALAFSAIPSVANVAALEAAIVAAGLNQLCFDMQQKGFFLNDTTSTFKWRSKDFNFKGQISQLRRMYVVGEGTFTVNVFADGVNVTAKTFTAISKSRQVFTVAPIRGNTWSFQFVGNSNAKIYEYGRYEDDKPVKMSGGGA